MTFETDDQKRTISRWLKLAIQLNGAADSGQHDEFFEPAQFHVRRNGLALLVAYLLHAIDIGHAVVPK